MHVIESAVILSYLEDKYGASASKSPSFTPDTPEGRQQMALLVRMHDLYVASPNCTAAGFSHSQVGRRGRCHRSDSARTPVATTR